MARVLADRSGATRKAGAAVGSKAHPPQDGDIVV
jgi:hypothetical protein